MLLKGIKLSRLFLKAFFIDVKGSKDIQPHRTSVYCFSSWKVIENILKPTPDIIPFIGYFTIINYSLFFFE